MQVNTGKVVALLRDGYTDIVFNKDVLQHAARLRHNDPPAYNAFRQKLTETGAIDLTRFDEEVAAKAAGVPTLASLRYTADAIAGLPLTSGCIVKNYLYRDLSILAAPGGVGKTTQVLFEMIHIALGRKLWGLDVESPGRCVLVTAEDSWQKCGARLHRLMEDMGLTSEERGTVLENVIVWDVRGTNTKLVASDKDIILTTLADRIIEQWRDQGVVLLTLDPLVSFGADEERVNSNASALVTAGVRIVNGLNCCVRYIHHTGQAVARDGTTDQYAGRGGSALSDGARMVAVLQRREINHPDVPRQLFPIDPNAGLTVLCRPKLTDCPPDQPEIWIERIGFRFNHCWRTKEGAEAKKERIRDSVVDIIQRELDRGERHTTNSATYTSKLYIETDLTRQQFTDGVKDALVEGWLEKKELPKEERDQANRTYFLNPTKKI